MVMEVLSKRRRGRPKWRRLNNIRNDLSEIGLSVGRKHKTGLNGGVTQDTSTLNNSGIGCGRRRRLFYKNRKFDAEGSCKQ